MKAPRPSPSSPPPCKRSPCPSNSPPPGPHHAHAITISSRRSTTVAPPPCCRTSSGEGRNQTLASSSLFSPPRDEPPWPLSLVHHGQALQWSMSHGLDPCGFLSRNKSGTRKSSPFCKEAPWFLCNQGTVHEFLGRPHNFQK
jgi:hypothetical protein